MPLTWPDARHIYLSPHLDDAVLSCGGTIYEQAQAGEPVAVVTVFAASPPADRPLSAFAGELHARWRASAAESGASFSDPVAVRRREDEHAMLALGANVRAVHLDLPDCIYRYASDTGEALYASEEAIFGAVHPDDPALAELSAVPALPEGSTLYVPLAIGHHVDHQLVHHAVRGWKLPPGRVRYYEDYPYAVQQGEPVETMLARCGAWQPLLIPLSEQALEAKIRAAAAYQSQISTFWRSREAMAEALRDYARQIGGERVWVPAG